MRIERARELGFCFGVRRAVEVLEKAAAAHGGVETLGAAVHNSTVIEELSKKGVRAVRGLEEAHSPVLAISSHGVAPEVTEAIKARGARLIDTTCPRVRHAQAVAKALFENKFYVVVYGEQEHPEVKGILGWAGGNGAAVIEPSGLDLTKVGARVGILSQTTRSQEGFAKFSQALAGALLPQSKELRIINTICHATQKRQNAARDLAQRNDVVIVAGGRNSSNTRRLAEACTSSGAKTYLVESASEIDPAWLSGCRSVGITAGTSTPDSVIDDLVHRLKQLSG
ncbi:MAG: 4-hydroxy-3-methylbut-2-enyl diphosphate reductase [Chloroflexi bacterium]|nr:4-hydroxy-3-methylbut-2-enyl diphosphate reductase [Chloroflexota bacterium]